MSMQLIEKLRSLVVDGGLSKSGLARAAGLHANTLRDLEQSDWNPTAETLRKLESYLFENDETPALVPIEEIIEEARNGRMYILVDDEDRENEGDLVIPAQMATPDAINFMATHGRGLICLTLTKKRTNQLGLDLMTKANGTRHETAFTTSIEALEGVTTGISAADRARTVSVAIDTAKTADDITTPGHVFPLIARDGGVLVRAGHTEAGVDISRLAGLNPSSVICEIMKDDGTMARMDDLVSFARHHKLKMGTIRDLIEYRMKHDHLVKKASESEFTSDYGGKWKAMTYANTIDGATNVVLQKGEIEEGKPTLVRMHAISIFDDVLGQTGPKKRILQRSMDEIGRNGSGIIVVLMNTAPQKLQSEIAQDAQKVSELRDYGIGAQILVDLGISDMVLLSNSHTSPVGLEGYGLKVVGEHEIPE